jgi:signal transduction histidine kinase
MNSRPGTAESFAGQLVAAAANALSADAAALWLLDDSGAGLLLSAGYQFPSPRAPAASPSSAALPGGGASALPASLLQQDALASGRASVEDASRDSRGAELPEGYTAALCVSLGGAERSAPPLGSTARGTLCVYQATSRIFTDSEAEILRALADLGAASLGWAATVAIPEPAPPAPAHHPRPDDPSGTDAERARLARVTAHQLRSPITIAQSLLRNLLKGYAGPISDQQRDVLGRIAGQLDYLSHLVDDFLDLAASKAPPASGQEGPVVLNLSVARAVLVLQPRAEEKDVRLALRQCREELVVWASEEGLDHIFHNLVENAVKYTPCGGQVAVSVSRSEEHSEEATTAPKGYAQVTVVDTGIGIPAEAQAHLFEEFYRAPNARACNAVGTGLGLAIVKGLVDRYHGRIAVQSAEGQGTTFAVWIPLRETAPLEPV